MASAAKPAAERPCDRVNGTLITVGSPVYLSLTPQDLDSQPHPDEITGLVKDWTSRFFNLTEVIPASPGYITKGTVKEQVHLSSNLKCGRVRLRGCIFTIAVLAPQQTLSWAHYFDSPDSEMDDDLQNPWACKPIQEGEVSYLAVSWLKQLPKQLKKPDLLDAAKAFLSRFGAIRSAFLNRNGIYVALHVTEPKSLCQVVRDHNIHLLGHSCSLLVLDEESALMFQHCADADSDYDSDLVPISQRSDVDEFATDSMSSGSSSRKQKKKAYKKRAKARKRSLSGSKTDCGTDDAAGTSGQPPKRSALPPTNQEPPTDGVAPETPASLSLGHELPPTAATSLPTQSELASASQPQTSQPIQVDASSPTQASKAHAQAATETSLPSTKRPAKKARWIHVDFNKVEVNIPAATDVITLLVRPVDPSKLLRELHPLKLATFLNSTFGPVQALRDIRAGGLAVDLLPPTAKVEAALATTSILDVQVTVTRPLTAAACAVVTGVHPDLTESEILTEISSETPVSAVKRLAKPGQKSWAVKLTFSGITVPDKVRLFGRTHTTKPYSDRPLRCHRCHRFGHPARVCRSAARCMVCSGDHLSESCPQPEQPRCCNCGGPHPANSASCPALAFQAKVITVKQASNTSFKAARKAVTSAARSYASALKGPADQPSAEPTGSAASKPSRAPAPSQGHQQPTRPAVTAAISTQTDERLPEPQPETTLPPFDQLEQLLKNILGILESAETKNSFALATKRVTAVLEGFRRSHRRGDKGV